MPDQHRDMAVTLSTGQQDWDPVIITNISTDSSGAVCFLQHHLLKSFRRRKKKSSRGSKSDKGSQEGMSDIVRMDELEEAERKAAKPRWKRRQFWRTAIPLFVSAVLLIVGTVLALKHYQTQVSGL